ncbi:MAG: 4-(cytidine 5'-diphospho)-2-C-methyl-D-erythritol kinase [Desertimonas sp.]
MAEAVRVLAPAKLTWSLRIRGVRADGYHELDAEFVSLDLADELHIDPAGDGLSVSGPYADGVPTDGSNLVARALVAAGRRAGVHIVKRIPHGGGLGGGSADAGAILRWAGVDDPVVATRLGADVPFCVRGGRARVGGIGEVLTALPDVARTVTLVVPPFGVSTPAVYRAWDDMGAPNGDGPNDLEPAALVVEPRLADWRDAIMAAAGVRPVLAGSGSTWFVPGERDNALDSLRSEGAAVVVARTTR